MTAAYGNRTEAVGVFADEAGLESAVDGLLENGFDRADISLMASEETVRARLGHAYRSVEEAEDAADVPTMAYVSRDARTEAGAAIVGALFYLPAVAGAAAVVASGGALAAAVAAAAFGGGVGAGIGAILATILQKHHADAIARQLAEGGLLLFVRTRDGAHEETARRILADAGARDVHVHVLPDAPPRPAGG